VEVCPKKCLVNEATYTTPAVYKIVDTYEKPEEQGTAVNEGSLKCDDTCVFCGICAKKCPTDAITVDRGAKTWSIKRMQCIQCSCCVEVCPKKCLVNEATYTTPAVYKIVDTYEKPEEQGTAANEGSLKCDDTCVFCGICAKKCPQAAITVDRGEKKWEVDDDKCTRCGLCIEGCPKKSLKIE
jgi:formate hydrogenlyase subunit 6/NADH:ubiquinone oxidoreductase subunit I